MSSSIREFVTAMNTVFAKNQADAIRNAYGIQLSAYKPLVQTVSASTTFVSDDTLAVELMPGRYSLRLWLPTPTMTAAGGIKVQFIADNGLAVSAISLSVSYLLTGVAPAVTPIVALSSSVGGGTTNAWTAVEITGSVAVTQQGYLRLQWAQVAASGATSVAAGATIEARQIT